MNQWWKIKFGGDRGPTGSFAKGKETEAGPAVKRRSRFWRTVVYARVVTVENQEQAASAARDGETLALIANGKKPKWLIFCCPSGCGELLRINLSPVIHPCWRLRISKTGKLSIYPSVDRNSGCGAHFFLTANVARLL